MTDSSSTQSPRIQLIVPTSLRTHTSNQKTIELPGLTFGEILTAMKKEFPELAKSLTNEDGNIADHVNVFINNQNIRDLQGTDTALQTRDEILLVPALAGG